MGLQDLTAAVAQWLSGPGTVLGGGASPAGCDARHSVQWPKMAVSMTFLPSWSSTLHSILLSRCIWLQLPDRHEAAKDRWHTYPQGRNTDSRPYDSQGSHDSGASHSRKIL
ncbi:hypothetical protein PLICRDRAFT_538238 [Plicaturopsis crispa FD-325 SS-3]|nr:hypothetical protein PLICRDRAFT_538238 [Plicaturopsis crispa FD-325 SS-3]